MSLASPIKAAAAIMVATLVAGCATAPVQPSSQTAKQKPLFDQSQDAHFLYTRASAALQHWDQHDEPAALAVAFKDFKAAFALNSDNVNYQRGYYLASYPLAAIGRLPYADLKRQYDAMIPALQSSVSSPARILYLMALRDDTQSLALTTVTADALSQAPQDRYLWDGLSQAVSDLNYGYFSAALSKKALELGPDSSDIAVDIAESLAWLAQRNDCTTLEAPLRKRAINYFQQADKLNKDNPYVLSELGYQYSMLNLSPLAKMFKQKAYDLEPDVWTAYYLAYTEIALKNFDKARALGRELLQSEDTLKGHEILSLVEFMEGNIDLASEHALKATQYTDISVAEYTTWMWLASLSDSSISYEALAPAVGDSSFPTELTAYIRSGEQTPFTAPESFDACERATSAFVNGVNMYRQGKVGEAKRFFTQGANPINVGWAAYDFSVAALKALPL